MNKILVKYLTILDAGDTTFKEGEVISPEAYERENQRVKELGLKPAFGEHLGDIIPAHHSSAHPTLQKYRELADKYPDQIGRLIDRAKGGKASLGLERGFGESFEDYLQRPDVKAKWDALNTAIEELQERRV